MQLLRLQTCIQAKHLHGINDISRKRVFHCELCAHFAAFGARSGLVKVHGVQVEPEKLHPKDWANPGRVRVQVKKENGQLANPNIKNSMWLIPLIEQLEAFRAWAGHGFVGGRVIFQS
jgi:hypothetical protein